MKDYLKKFKAIGDYNLWKNSENCIAPNVSLIEDNQDGVVDYNSLIIITPSLTMNGWVYGETPSTPILSGNTGNGNVTYMYKVSTADDSTYTSTQPSEVGTYTIKAIIEAKGFYSDGSCTSTFSIAKSGINPTVTMNDWTYGETASDPVVSGNTDNGNVTYMYKVSTADDSTYTSTKPSNAGTYTVKATIEATSNYSGSSCTSTFTINKVTPNVVSPVPNVLTYNKSAQELATIGSTDFGTLKYSLDNSNWSTSMPTATNGGTYTLYYKVDGDSNINNITSNSITCSIAEKRVSNPTIILSQDVYTYNGSSCTPTPTVKDGNDVINPIEYTISYLNNTNAGTASVVISDIVDGNYYIEGVQTFTINKADINPIVTMNDWTYGGTASDPVVSGNTGNGNVTYMYKVSTADDSTYTSTKPNDAGTYTVKATIEATSNYNGGLCTSTFKIINNNVNVNNILLCKYNVTSTSNATKLYDSSRLIYMEVDGVEVTLASSYKFNTTGEHTVKFTFANGAIPICENAFYGCSSLTSITIPDSVTSIDFRAFYNCSSLTSITIPNLVTSISDQAFYNCSSLTSITIPDSVTSIGESAFYGCSYLTSSITIPDSVTLIGAQTFQGCSSLTSITIPDSVTYIAENVFYGCSSLTSITIPDSVTYIGENAFSNCNQLQSITINSNSLVSKKYTYSSGFRNIFGTQVKEYIINNSVTSIGTYAFYNCVNLTSITIGSSVTSIGTYAFSGCSSLKEIICNRTTAPSLGNSHVFDNVARGGVLITPSGSSGYSTWMSTSSYYLGYYQWYNAVGTFGDTEPTLQWSSSSYTITSSYFSTPSLTKQSGISVTYKSSNTSVATINSSGTVSKGSNGTTYIQAIFAGNSTYKPKVAVYTLTVSIYSGGSSGGGGSHE